MKPATRLTLFAVVVLGAILLWNTLQSQKAACTVCVAYKGGRNCAHATAASPKEAQRSAQTTACGILARGMDQAIECDNVAPVKVDCAS